MHILIADDHAVVRRGLRDILADALPTASFAEAGDGDELLRLLSKSSQAGLVVLDVNMPGRTGLDVLRDLKKDYPRLPVIIMSVQAEDQYALRCLRAGASAYLNKDSAPEELAIAARRVLSGSRYITPHQAETLFAALEEPAGKPLHESLSDREHEVLRMIASGVALKEIAERLHISVKTVSSYRARILEKMRMKNNAELIRYALGQGLIDPGEASQ